MIELQPDLDLTTEQAERVLGVWLNDEVICSSVAALKGGMVNSAYRLDFNLPPYRAVVKIHDITGASFHTEAEALRYLKTETRCPVPQVYLQDSSARIIPYAFLLLEHVPGVCLNDVEPDPSGQAEIDRELADILGELHHHKAERWGLVGASQGDQGEVGATNETWAELFVSRLSEVRSHPAFDERLAPGVLSEVDEAIGLAHAGLEGSGEPTLVHGDVWDGNVIVRREADGKRWRIAALLDPNLQFADAELELAYLDVFDADRRIFFAAYARHHPLRPGYEHRRLFYWLHTALLHVGLFGDEFFRDFTARTATEIVGR